MKFMKFTSGTDVYYNHNPAYFCCDAVNGDDVAGIL